MKRLIRLKHFAYNTELAYLDWVERFFAYIREATKSGPAADLTPEAVQNFLSHLAITKRVSSSTQNQALCALRIRGTPYLFSHPHLNIKPNMTPQNSKTASEFSKVFPEYPRKRDRINPRLVDAFVNAYSGPSRPVIPEQVDH